MLPESEEDWSSGLFQEPPVNLAAPNHFGGDDKFAQFALGRQVVHQLQHQIFQNHAEAPRSDLALEGQVSDRLNRVVSEPQPHVLEFEQALILTDESVLWFRQNLDE